MHRAPAGACGVVCVMRCVAGRLNRSPVAGLAGDAAGGGWLPDVARSARWRAWGVVLVLCGFELALCHVFAQYLIEAGLPPLVAVLDGR